MNKWRTNLFTLLLAGTLGLFFLTTGAVNAACPDSITNYWKLDEETPVDPGGTYVDFINGNDGTGIANPTAAIGQVNGAQEFDEATTGINVPADRAFDWYKDESFSIELWIRRDGTVPGVNQVFIGRYGGDTATNLHWWVGIEGAGSNVARFTLGDKDGGNITSVIGNTDLTDDNSWHHVVAVRDRSLSANGQILLYVDGQLDVPAVDAEYDAGFDSGSAELNIGWLNSSTGYHFGGMLDEIALYDRALTLTEIEGHYNNGVGVQDYCQGSAAPSDAPYPEDTISHWKLDETTPVPGDVGGNYTDSFNGNDGAGNVNPTAVTGQVNEAQEFDAATTTGIDVAADRSFNWYKDESFSIEFWIKRDGAVGSTQVAIGRNEGVPAANLHWYVGVEVGGGNGAEFILGDNDGGSITTVTGDTDITNNSWHHVVAVKDASAGANGQNLLYVDGALDILAGVDATYNAGFDSLTADLNIGWLDLGGGYHFDGMLDEVALYDRALTPAEILTHYTDGLAGHGIDYVEPGDDGDDDDDDDDDDGGGSCFIATAAK